MAELGNVRCKCEAAVGKTSGDAAAWLDAYASKDGWYRLDQAQRRLEAWVANLDEEPEERPLGVVRRAYEDACHAMAEGFTKALVKAGWTVPGALHQTRIFSEVVAEQAEAGGLLPRRRDALRDGRRARRAPTEDSEVTVRAAVGALPSITPIGMAALMPGASASFSVVEQGGKLGARIDDSFLPDLAARKKFAAARVPKLVDVALDELLSLQPSKLAKKLDGAQVVVVRSQEIDHAGEAGFTFQARQVMDTVIDNLARAIRKLAAAGVEHAVVTADHGHLFFADRPRRVDADRRARRRHRGAAPPLLDRSRRGHARRAACASPRRRSATRPTSSSCFRAAAACSGPAAISPSTTAARRFRSWSSRC